MKTLISLAFVALLSCLTVQAASPAPVLVVTQATLEAKKQELGWKLYMYRRAEAMARAAGNIEAADTYERIVDELDAQIEVLGSLELTAYNPPAPVRQQAPVRNVTPKPRFIFWR